jgi:hypothetical protein
LGFLARANEELSPNPWKVLGFIGASLLDFDVKVWTFKLSVEQIQRVFNEWKKVNQCD